MTANDSGHHNEDRQQFYRRIFIGILAFVVVILIIFFIIWAVLQPSKPRFVLQDATLYAFNVSSPNLLTSNIQVTISARNPNDRIGIFYENLDIYASYRNQQITLPTELPGTYQGHKDIAVWSPFLYGNAVPVAPYLADALSQDQNAGMVLIKIKANGSLKWKVGTWISGKYRINVNCPAYISYGEKNKGIEVGPAAIKYQFVQGCSVDVSS
ncbi:LEA_2 domain-containing protein [Cephalotus follicularis]|uniref:LEA_2 domain-containing protein n=1 Tax=Cephalotus follicularis TaxID=3775 RepID=A0A1Q3BI12_CEPFO|nr:LEA_2 domain-containing protein [Cephalotus follicularis]